MMRPGFLLAVALLSSAACAADPYPDHKRLLYYIDAQGHERPVKSRGDWAKRRHDILAGMQRVMGPLQTRAPLRTPELTEKFDGDGYTRFTLRLHVGQNDHCPAWLFVPAGIKPGERRAAIVALHQTDSIGKRGVTRLGLPNLAYGEELAQRGYVVIAPDFPSLGDYKPYDFNADTHPSGSMKGIANHMYCVDYLQSRGDVDGKRIGAIGHSLGGHNAMFLGVFDERVKVIVSSCGWTPFHDYYNGKLNGWAGERYMPRIESEFGLDPNRVPFDFYEIAAALAPRGFFTCSPLNDENFEVNGVRRAIPKVLEVYGLFNAANRLQARYPHAGHDFPVDTRREAYEFIDKLLEHRPARNLP